MEIVLSIPFSRLQGKYLKRQGRKDRSTHKTGLLLIYRTHFSIISVPAAMSRTAIPPRFRCLSWYGCHTASAPYQIIISSVRDNETAYRIAEQFIAKFSSLLCYSLIPAFKIRNVRSAAPRYNSSARPRASSIVIAPLIVGIMLSMPNS